MSALDHTLPDADAPRLRRFTVLGEAEPGLLPRLIEPLAKRGLIPRRLEAVVEGATMRVSLSVVLDSGCASHLAASLRATVGVIAVLADPPDAAHTRGTSRK
jgi:hypothetical protein